MLRRHLQSLRRTKDSAFVNASLADWLRDSVVPEKTMLFRGLLLMLHDWLYVIDLPEQVPAKVRRILSKKAILESMKYHLGMFYHNRSQFIQTFAYLISALF